MIRLVVADDQALVRGGFRVILDREPDLEVVGEAADGFEAVDQALRHRPDVVLMDIRMPGCDGIEATERICTEAPASTRVLILTTFDLDEYVYRAVRVGASGFLLKDVPPDDLVRGVHVVAAGEALLAAPITRRLLESFTRLPPPGDQTPSAIEELTGREREILRLVARGLSNAEIAAALVVGEATVKTHVSRVLGKLGLRDRVQAVVFAYETGFVEPGGG